MKIRVGTSGYSYKEWKGTFYPEQLPAKDMLSYYAEHFQAVELNNTFHRTPQPNVIESWKTRSALRLRPPSGTTRSFAPLPRRTCSFPNRPRSRFTSARSRWLTSLTRSPTSAISRAAA